MAEHDYYSTGQNMSSYPRSNNSPTTPQPANYQQPIILFLCVPQEIEVITLSLQASASIAALFFSCSTNNFFFASSYDYFSFAPEGINRLNKKMEPLFKTIRQVSKKSVRTSKLTTRRLLTLWFISRECQYCKVGGMLGGR